jgi:hypothetical protein
MLMLEGVATTAGFQSADNNDRINTRYSRFMNHENTAPAAFTGSYIVAPGGDAGNTVPQSASLEYALGQRLGSDTAQRSMQIACGAYGDANNATISYNETGQRLPKVVDPAESFRLLFGTGAGTGGSGGSSGPSPADLKKKRDASIVAELQRQAKSLKGRVSTSDRAKLDEHLSALADIEARLSTGGAGGSTTPMYPPVVCNNPTAPANVPNLDAVPASLAAHFDVLAQGLACDRVRFVAMSYCTKYEVSSDFVYGSSMDMHGVEHSVGDGNTTTRNAARGAMQKWNQYFANKLGAFVDRLQATPDGAGTLLDNTLILWQTDFGDTTHDGANMPFVLLGGAQNKLRMGRYLKVGKNGDGTGWKDMMPHNKVLVSIMQAFGVDTQTFGVPEFTGPAPLT